MRTTHALAGLAALVLLAGPAAAQQIYFFPAKGQSPEQQDADRGACHGWAVRQTGFDPGMARRPVAQQTGSTGGGILKGGALGAGGGALIGALAGNAGKGAAIGAIGGGLFGGVRSHSKQQQANNANRAAQARYDQAAHEYRRALAACMQGKGYSAG